MADHLTAEQTDRPERANRSDQTKDKAGPQVILSVVANWLTADRVMAFAAMHSAEVCYTCQARGTVRRASLREAGLTDMRKELVTILTEANKAYAILEDLKSELHLEEENAGIAFLRRTALSEHQSKREVATMQKTSSVEFRAVYVLVNKGFAEDVILAGERAGTRGATVIPARGEARSGDIPGLMIDNDKELILVITSLEKSQRLLGEIQADEVIMGKGQGKVFVVEVIDTLGIKFF